MPHVALRERESLKPDVGRELRFVTTDLLDDVFSRAKIPEKLQESFCRELTKHKRRVIACAEVSSVTTTDQGFIQVEIRDLSSNEILVFVVPTEISELQLGELKRAQNFNKKLLLVVKEDENGVMVVTRVSVVNKCRRLGPF